MPMGTMGMGGPPPQDIPRMTRQGGGNINSGGIPPGISQPPPQGQMLQPPPMGPPPMGPPPMGPPGAPPMGAGGPPGMPPQAFMPAGQPMQGPPMNAGANPALIQALLARQGAMR